MGKHTTFKRTHSFIGIHSLTHSCIQVFHSWYDRLKYCLPSGGQSTVIEKRVEKCTACRAVG